jgi:hypothetical protein
MQRLDRRVATGPRLEKNPSVRRIAAAAALVGSRNTMVHPPLRDCRSEPAFIQSTTIEPTP